MGAIAAGSVEMSHMACNMSLKICPGSLQNVFNAVHFQVCHTAAFRTDKVIMGGGIGIEMIYPVSHIEAADLADIRQQRKVAVHSSQADAWILLSYIPIYNIRGRMIFSGHQEILDQLPLSTVLQRCHKHPFLKTVIITVFIIRIIYWMSIGFLFFYSFQSFTQPAQQFVGYGATAGSKFCSSDFLFSGGTDKDGGISGGNLWYVADIY